MKNYKKNLCIRYIFYFFSLLILYYAKVKDISSPFFYPFLFCMMYFKISTVFVLFSYIVVSIISGLTMYNIVTTFIISLFISLIAVVHNVVLKKSIKKSYLIFYYVLSQILFLYKDFEYQKVLISAIGIIVLLCYINYFKAFYKKGNIVHFTIDQNICGAVFLIGLGLGMIQFPVISEYILKFAGTMLVLIMAYTYNTPICCIYAVLFGLGSCINGQNEYIFYFSVISIFCYAFKGYNVFFASMSVLVAEIILGLYFNIYGYYMYEYIIPSIIAVVLFMLFNKPICEYTKNKLGTNLNTFGVKTLVNRNKEQICYKMNELSQVFNEMNRLYSSLIKGKMTDEEVYHILTENTAKNLCVNCFNRKRCFGIEEKDNTINEFKTLFKIGLDRGKITILDFQPNLTKKCGKTNQLLTIINNLISNFKEYRQMIKNSDMSKLLVAEQLKGVSSLLDMLSMEIGSTLLFNSKLEDKIREEMAYSDIICEEVLCYEMNDYSSVSIVLNNSSIIDVASAENIISKILNHPYTMTLEQIGYYGNIYEFKPSAKFGYIFGASGKGKENISGDTFSFTMINKNRVMFAICDGMGTGKNAQNVSEISLNLIENFYKAGYDSQIILSSVNKLLSTSNAENYSALDIIVIDLNEGYADFIKLGAPDGIVKTSESMERIRSGALPLGILEEVEPVIIERELKRNDIFYMFSDGVIDSFGSIENLMEFIDMQTTTNPQTLADIILQKSITYNNSIDDKTIICVRIFKNY